MMIQRHHIVHILSALFGIGAWITVNGVWVELPQLVLHLPEGWNLPSYLAIIVQLANIGPIIYVTILHFSRQSAVKDRVAVSISTAIGASACLLLTFFWKKTLHVFNAERSIVLFILVFLMALVDCTSSVLFLPFMSAFKEKYLISYMVGEGLSGLIPSILALIQGVGGNPECKNVTIHSGTDNSTTLEPFYPEPSFSTNVFFVILFLMDISSLTAFFLLNYLPIVKHEKDTQPSVHTKRSYEIADVESSTESTSNVSMYKYIGQNASDFENGLNTHENTYNNSSPKTVSNFTPNSTNLYLLFLQAWLCALGNGVFTSIQSFSGLPYGNRTFHLCVTLSAMANPLASCLAFLFPTKRVAVVSLHSIVGTLISCYIMTTAVLSPKPPLVGTISGEVIIVLCWILYVTLFSYAKTCVAYILREDGRRALFWCGACTQAGSAIGSLIMFILINVYNLFVSYNPCQD